MSLSHPCVTLCDLPVVGISMLYVRFHAQNLHLLSHCLQLSQKQKELLKIADGEECIFLAS